MDMCLPRTSAGEYTDPAGLGALNVEGDAIIDLTEIGSGFGGMERLDYLDVFAI